MPEFKDTYESQEDVEKAAAKIQEYHDRFKAKRGSGNGGSGELYHLRQHRECKESRRPKSDENSEAFGVRLLFSGFAFLDVPD